MRPSARSDSYLVRSAAVSILAAVAAVLGLVAVAPAASAVSRGDPSGTVTVTPAAPSTLRTLLEPLVGSPTDVIYTESNRLAIHDFAWGPVTV